MKYQVDILFSINSTLTIEADSVEEVQQKVRQLNVVETSLPSPTIDRDVLAIFDDNDEVVFEG